MVSAKAPAHEQEINYVFTDKQIKKVLWQPGRSCTNIQTGPLNGGRPVKPGKHNLKRLFAVVCVLGLLQSPATAMAQAGLAMKAGVVGVKVLIGLVGVAEGKPFEINSIFGDQRPGPQPLTAEELGRALDESLAKSFRSEYLKTTLDQVTELQMNVREYNSSGSVASRREQIHAIIHNADKIRGGDTEPHSSRGFL